jgi:uncharacterized protein YqhQ
MITKIFEKEIAKEMKWVGIAIMVLIFLLSFGILALANVILADIEILKFIDK